MFSSNTTQVSSGGYQISRSLRFNSADSAYLNRTPAGAGNRRTFTFSTWIKRSFVGTGADNSFFDSYVDNSNRFDITFGGTANAQLYISNVTAGSTTMQIGTSAVFRDASAWYHIVFSVDTTQATSTNRVAIYVNGVAQTVSGTYPSLNEQLTFNYAIQHTIGAAGYSGLTNYLGAYMTEVNFIDGSQLTPSSFGETNAQTGVWQPKAYSGSYGTNGFYLNFSDNSNTTAATLGKDYSGNGNNWTPNNFSVSAGAGNDSLVDVPTPYGVDTGVGGNVRGNYCTWNPLKFGGDIQAPTNGNLDVTAVGSAYGNILGTIGVSSGKWYWECVLNGGNGTFGIANDQILLSSYSGQTANGWSYEANGNKSNNGSYTAYGASWTVGDVIGVALDMDAGTVAFYKNGTSQGTAFTGLTGFLFPLASEDSSTPDINATANFGQRPFAYTAPSGFKALCTQNLPTPTIGATTATQAGKFFNPVLYTGNGGTQSVTGVGFQPDWVWVKGRSGATSHSLFDAVRGVQKRLVSNSTNAESTETTALSAFGSDGFTTGALTEMNTSSATYVAWNWKANGSGSSNTAGSITSTVSANTTAGFSIVTYTGNATSGATVGHGLGVAPSMIILKIRSTTGNWPVYHVSTGNTKALYLDLTLAQGGDFTGAWNNTTPTSTVFTLGNSTETNASSGTFVAYCFTPIAGYSAFGSYTGNGSADGPFVFTGMRPAFVMLKNTTTAGNSWHMIDTARGTYNVYGPSLDANASSAEITYTICDLLSNGFKLRDTNQAWNKSGDLYIYMAFASNPFKTSLARQD